MHRIALFLLAGLSLMAPCSYAQELPRVNELPAILKAAPSVLPPEGFTTAYLNNRLGTHVQKEITTVTGQPFDKAVRVTLVVAGKDTNDAQFVVRTVGPATQGDALVALFYIRGKSQDGNVPAQAMFGFEKSLPPWTKSVTQTITVAPKDAETWQRVVIPFTTAETYATGEAIVTLRLAFQPQAIEVGGLSVVNLGKTLTQSALQILVADLSPLGTAQVTINTQDARQIMEGFGGNYAKGRAYLDSSNDAVGRWTLDNLKPAHARVGLPLQYFAPSRGVYKPDDKRVKDVYLLMQELSRRKIPIVISVWDAANWMIADPARKTQRIIPPDRYPEAVDALTQFLIIARDKYSSTVPYISFNEADGGYQIKFTVPEISKFIQLASSKFASQNLPAKWLVGDTSNGASFAAYARPLLEDPGLKSYLGPLSFHSWDALNASEASYQAIADLGKKYNKSIWCLEVGYDAQLWQAKPSPFGTWDNALNLSLAYEKSIRLARASLLDYWEYQEDYPLSGGPNGDQPYPAFFVLRQFAETLLPGWQIIGASSDRKALLPLISRDPKSGKTNVLLINTQGAGNATVASMPPRATFAVTKMSSASATSDTSETVTTGDDGSVTVALPARAIVMLISK